MMWNNAANVFEFWRLNKTRVKIYTQNLFIAGISLIMVKFPLWLIKHHDMKAFCRMEVQLHAFLITVVDGHE